MTPSKAHTGENFPVASVLIHPRHRPVILAFYRFARTADDIADHATLPPEDKYARLEALEDTLLSKSDSAEDALPLRQALHERGLSPRHAQDLLAAFRMDVGKSRYRDWDELMHYCRFSAMPVGRFVLDVHGESEATWPASDALCAALQVINHLQDCRKDYRQIDRVYVPLDALAREGVSVEALGADKASPALRRCLHGLAGRTSALLDEAAPFSAQIVDLRLAVEVAAIHRLACRLTGLLLTRDPLSERVHLSKGSEVSTALAGIGGALLQRIKDART
jgi:squalene synthase HpnC